jgi:hypothetical protein
MSNSHVATGASPVPPKRSEAERARTLRLSLLCLILCLPAFSHAQTAAPEWCRSLPRAEYKSLERIPISDPWFEVYKPASDVFAIYEPHQAEETIGYLIVGEKRALLFDTGMGISDIKKVSAELTKLPIIVLNSHTHDDHVAATGNSTPFTGWTPTSRAGTRKARAKMRRRKSRPIRFAERSRRDLT